MKRRTNKKGFTIVELVIVIAVIAILATTLVPTFSGIINKANESAAKQAAKNAYTSYMVEHAAEGNGYQYFLYQHNGRFVTVENGAATGIYDTQEEALTAMIGADFDANKLVNSGVDKLFIYGGELTQPTDPSQPEEPTQVDWAGKTIVFLGDSIPHGQAVGFSITTPYPQIVAENLGMNLINYAIGGSTIAYQDNYGGVFASYEEFLAAEKDPNLYYQVINGQSYKSYKCTGSNAWTEKLAINSNDGTTQTNDGRTTSPLYENPGSITISLPEGIEMYIAAYNSNGEFVKDKFTGAYLTESTKTISKEEAAYIRIMVRTKDTKNYVPANTAAQITLVDENSNAVNPVQNWVQTDGSFRTPLTARYDLMTDDADVIVVHCGTNDFQYDWTSVGTLTDRTNHTFYGALNNLILGLQEKYPGKPIIFMTPLQRMQDGYNTTASKNSYGYTLNDYRNIILSTCASYGIPVIDTYASGPSPYNPEQASWFDSKGTHPNQQGHNMLGKLVAEELREIYNVVDYREQWENPYLAPLEIGSMTVEGGLCDTNNNLFYNRARSSVAVTAEEDISVTFTADPAARFRLCVYNADGTLKVFHDWTETSATYTVYAGESFRLFFSASDASKVLSEEDLTAFAETIKIDVK